VVLYVLGDDDPHEDGELDGEVIGAVLPGGGGQSLVGFLDDVAEYFESMFHC